MLPDEHRPALLQRLGLAEDDARLQQLITLARQLNGLPRHLSQHVGGFVLTEGPLERLVPIENATMEHRSVIEWDKDDIDELKMMKVDVLALGMLSAIRRCIDLVNTLRGERWELATIPRECTRTYDMICRADTVGVFQIESRAQMSMLPRLRPRQFIRNIVRRHAELARGGVHGIQTLLDFLETLRVDVEPVLVIAQHVNRFLRLRLCGGDHVDDVFQARIVIEQVIEPRANRTQQGHARIVAFRERVHCILRAFDQALRMDRAGAADAISFWRIQPRRRNQHGGETNQRMECRHQLLYQSSTYLA